MLMCGDPLQLYFTSGFLTKIFYSDKKKKAAGYQENTKVISVSNGKRHYINKSTLKHIKNKCIDINLGLITSIRAALISSSNKTLYHV